MSTCDSCLLIQVSVKVGSTVCVDIEKNVLFHDQGTIHAEKGCAELCNFYMAALMFLTGHGIKARTHTHAEITHFHTPLCYMNCFLVMWYYTVTLSIVSLDRFGPNICGTWSYGEARWITSDGLLAKICLSCINCQLLVYKLFLLAHLPVVNGVSLFMSSWAISNMFKILDEWYITGTLRVPVADMSYKYLSNSGSNCSPFIATIRS